MSFLDTTWSLELQKQRMQRHNMPSEATVKRLNGILTATSPTRTERPCVPIFAYHLNERERSFIEMIPQHNQGNFGDGDVIEQIDKQSTSDNAKVFLSSSYGGGLASRSNVFLLHVAPQNSQPNPRQVGKLFDAIHDIFDLWIVNKDVILEHTNAISCNGHEEMSAELNRSITTSASPDGSYAGSSRSNSLMEPQSRHSDAGSGRAQELSCLSHLTTYLLERVKSFSLAMTSLCTVPGVGAHLCSKVRMVAPRSGWECYFHLLGGRRCPQLVLNAAIDPATLTEASLNSVLTLWASLVKKNIHHEEARAVAPFIELFIGVKDSTDLRHYLSREFLLDGQAPIDYCAQMVEVSAQGVDSGETFREACVGYRLRTARRREIADDFAIVIQLIPLLRDFVSHVKARMQLKGFVGGSSKSNTLGKQLESEIKAVARVIAPHTTSSWSTELWERKIQDWVMEESTDTMSPFYHFLQQCINRCLCNLSHLSADAVNDWLRTSLGSGYASDDLDSDSDGDGESMGREEDDVFCPVGCHFKFSLANIPSNSFSGVVTPAYSPLTYTDESISIPFSSLASASELKAFNCDSRWAKEAYVRAVGRGIRVNTFAKEPSDSAIHHLSDANTFTVLFDESTYEEAHERTGDVSGFQTGTAKEMLKEIEKLKCNWTILPSAAAPARTIPREPFASLSVAVAHKMAKLCALIIMQHAPGGEGGGISGSPMECLESYDTSLHRWRQGSTEQLFPSKTILASSLTQSLIPRAHYDRASWGSPNDSIFYRLRFLRTLSPINAILVALNWLGLTTIKLTYGQRVPSVYLRHLDTGDFSRTSKGGAFAQQLKSTSQFESHTIQKEGQHAGVRVAADIIIETEVGLVHLMTPRACTQLYQSRDKILVMPLAASLQACLRSKMSAIEVNILKRNRHQRSMTIVQTFMRADVSASLVRKKHTILHQRYAALLSARDSATRALSTALAPRNYRDGSASSLFTQEATAERKRVLESSQRALRVHRNSSNGIATDDRLPHKSSVACEVTMSDDEEGPETAANDDIMKALFGTNKLPLKTAPPLPVPSYASTLFVATRGLRQSKFIGATDSALSAGGSPSLSAFDSSGFQSQKQALVDLPPTLRASIRHLLSLEANYRTLISEECVISFDITIRQEYLRAFPLMGMLVDEINSRYGIVHQRQMDLYAAYTTCFGGSGCAIRKRIMDTERQERSEIASASRIFTLSISTLQEERTYRLGLERFEEECFSSFGTPCAFPPLLILLVFATEAIHASTAIPYSPNGIKLGQPALRQRRNTYTSYSRGAAKTVKSSGTPSIAPTAANSLARRQAQTEVQLRINDFSRQASIKLYQDCFHRKNETVNRERSERAHIGMTIGIKSVQIEEAAGRRRIFEAWIDHHRTGFLFGFSPMDLLFTERLGREQIFFTCILELQALQCRAAVCGEEMQQRDLITCVGYCERRQVSLGEWHPPLSIVDLAAVNKGLNQALNDGVQLSRLQQIAQSGIRNVLSGLQKERDSVMGMLATIEQADREATFAVEEDRKRVVAQSIYSAQQALRLPSQQDISRADKNYTMLFGDAERSVNFNPPVEYQNENRSPVLHAQQTVGGFRRHLVPPRASQGKRDAMAQQSSHMANETRSQPAREPIAIVKPRISFLNHDGTTESQSLYPRRRDIL